MASTSASSVQKYFQYDVFLSFRGQDVRKTFVDHLHHALNQRGIITYKDDEKIEKGERISEQLIRAIEDSRLHIIVFSKNYASSSWCLDELVKIMQCQKMSEQTAYPIFYDVEPTDVRNQTGVVEEAFAEVAEKRKRKRTSEDADLEKEKADVGRWRNALKEAASLAGWELINTVDGHEAMFIEKIIEEISPKLHFINLNIDDNLVGMEHRVKSVISSLKVDSDDVCMIGIKGMGGGGKTTLARAIFDHISIHFESKSFVENVRERSQGSGLKELQKQVLRDALNDQKLDVNSVYDGKYMMKKLMHGRKALVVLDDVDDRDQLEALAGKHTWFKPGSRIIITTRDEQVLIAHSVNFIYDVNLLSNEEALCLFSKYAFGREVPFHGYEELSRKVVHYAVGLPLTIKVLGSHLCGRSELEWEDSIERLKNIPWDKTLKRLEISYNGLDYDQKEIFLDVVCILKGKKKDDAIRILKSCGFNAQIGLRVLEQKSLITISRYHTLDFHDHIEEMGRNIVRRLHPNEPSKHSRLWIQEEINDILVNGLGTKETRSLILDPMGIDQSTIMKGLRKMKELRLLYVHPPYRNFTEVDGVSECLPDGLQFLHWYEYPFRSLPESFQPNKLVCLKMHHSNISELWEGGERKVFNKLKFLDLGYSKLRTFDLSMTPYLEVLNLGRCSDFVELHMSTGCLNFKVLDLTDSKVTNFNLGMTPHLEKLNLNGCTNFVELQLPVECSNLKVLDLRSSKVSNLNLGMTPHLEKLNLDGCHDIVELQLPVECLNLKVLELSGSMGNNFNHEMNPHLEQLYLYDCSYREDLETPLGFLKKPTINFQLENCLNFRRFWVDKKHESGNLDSVTKFDIRVSCDGTCPQHPENNLPAFGFTCKYEEPRSSPSGNLEKLIYFDPCTCGHREYFLATISSLQNLRALSLQEGVPRDLWRLQSLEKLTLRFQQFQYLPDSICMLKHLKSLELEYCSNLEQLPDNICKLKFLKRLEISNCKKFTTFPEELGSIECLEELRIFRTAVSRLPQSIYQLKGLRIDGFREL